MATEGRQDLWTYDAHQDLSANDEYHFVTVDSNGVASKAGNGARALVLVEAHVGVASVVIGGVVKVTLGAQLSPMTPVTSNADGRAREAGSGDAINGVLLEGGDAGEVGTLLVSFGQISSA